MTYESVGGKFGWIQAGVTFLKLGPSLYSPFMMVKMYPIVMVSELSVNLSPTLILVVYSNIFDMCYDNLYAANDSYVIWCVNLT